MKPAEAEPLSSSNEPELPPAEGAEEVMPLPADPKVIFLGGILFILSLAALYTAAEIVWPLVFAFVLSLLLNPLLRFLAKLHVPRVLGALLLVIAVLALVVGLGTAISGPAATWAGKLPDGLPGLFQRLRFLEEPFSALQHFWQQIRDFAGWQNGADASPGSAILAKLFSGKRTRRDCLADHDLARCTESEFRDLRFSSHYAQIDPTAWTNRTTLAADCPRQAG